MPAIRGVYDTHPVSGAGIWVELSSSPAGVWSGLSFVHLQTIIPTGGHTVTSYATEINNWLKNEFSYPLNIPKGDPIYKDPPEGYFKVGKILFAQKCIVTLEFSSLSPMVLSNVTVTNGAHRSITL